MSDAPLLACVIAVELDPGAAPARRKLDPGDAGQLAAHVMADLAARLPEVERCGLALAGALYDVTELLQPHWPLFHDLRGHYLRGAGAAARLMGLGAAEGRMPGSRFEPDPRRAGSALAFVPFVLIPPEDIAEAVNEALEARLGGSGQLGAASALGLQSLFGLRLGHAQYFTRYDLCALMAAQLDPLGLAPLWTLLECALLSPYGEVSVVDGAGIPWSYRGHQVHSGFTGYADWLRSDAGRSALADGRVAEAFAETLLVQRQYLALLRAHAVDLRWPDGRWESLIEVLGPGTPNRVCAVRSPQLGLVALIALEGDTPVGIGFPFSDDGLGELGPVFEAFEDVPDVHGWPVDPETGRLRLPGASQD
jgi:hypothetical protein